MTTSEPMLLRRSEAAKLLSMPLSTLEKQRDIPYIKLGRAVYYAPADLRAWAEAKKVHPPPSAAIAAK